ncbi:MAG TPA: prepilin peptidase, partial [Candidatus Paceibacterota bacterium]
MISWTLLGGRCRYCHTKISVQYPLVELTGALLSLAIFWIYRDPAMYAYWMAVWMILLFVAVYDVRHKIIPWSCSGLLVFLALVGLYTRIVPATWGSVVAGPVLALPLFLFFALSGGRWMGLGDSALELSLGWFLGMTLGLTAFMFAFWTGALVGIVLMSMRRGVTMKSEVPFAPFLILGALIAFTTHVDLFQTLPLFFQ